MLHQPFQARNSLLSSILIVVVGCVTQARGAEPPGNIVKNWSFEQNGNFWNSGNQFGVGVYAGFDSADDGRNMGIDQGMVYQDLSTQPNQWYQLRFAVSGDWRFSAPSVTDTLWNTVVVKTTTWNSAGHDIDHLGWIHEDLSVLATATTTRLQFNLAGGNMSLLDSISAVPIPEPGSLATGIGLSLLVSRRPRHAQRRSAVTRPRHA